VPLSRVDVALKSVELPVTQGSSELKETVAFGKREVGNVDVSSLATVLVGSVELRLRETTVSWEDRTIRKSSSPCEIRIGR